ncbi:MAG TPA: hypothetical protein VJL39_03245 [Candidatus Paceibacterota bacterium]
MPKCLLVEGHPEVRIRAHEIIVALGFDVVSFDSALTAIHFIERNTYDVIVAGPDMPDTSHGLDAIA